MAAVADCWLDADVSRGIAWELGGNLMYNDRSNGFPASTAGSAVWLAGDWRLIMSFAHLPAMLISETEGWSDIAQAHPAAKRLLFNLVMPMSLIPPLMYAYAEFANPGAVFPRSVPALSGFQLAITGIVLFALQLAMVSFMAMLIQRMSMAQDHDPGHEAAYSLAAIAPVPLWLSSLALFVPSLAFNVMVLGAAWLASFALIRHGVRPLLKVDDGQKAHYIANMVTLAGIGAWIGLMIISAAILSMLLVLWRV